MDDKQFQYDAYKNNTFDFDVLEKSLELSKMSAYQYLYKFQLESTGYRRFDYKMADIYRTNNVNHVWSFVPRRWVYYVDKDFINVGKRITYKRSKLYEKDLSYNDIISNPQIFNFSYLVFIEGKLYTEGIRLLCKEDKTYVVFLCKEKPIDEGFTIAQIRDFIERNVDVTIFFIPNVGITNVTSNAYRAKENNAKDGLLYRTLGLSELAKYDQNTLSFIKYNGELISNKTNIEFGEKGIFLTKSSIQRAINTNPKNTNFTINLIPLRYLLDKIELTDKWFNIPMQDYPVAIDNCLVFDEFGDFIHKARVQSFYPNVYCVENIDDILANRKVFIYVFYYDNKQSVLKHQNLLEVYHKYVPDYLDKYRDGTILESIKNYVPTLVEYSIEDYQKSEEYDDHFKYKVNRMKEFIKADPNNFSRYLYDLSVHNNYYYVDVSKVNLESKLRMNNQDTGLDLKEFDEEMYMFVFRNDFKGMYDKLLVHVDGIRYETEHIYFTDNYVFLYVPVRMINNDSILEIEKLNQVLKEIQFTASDLINEVDIGQNAVTYKTLYNDLFLVDVETNQYINQDDYRIYYPMDDDYNADISSLTTDYILSNDKCYTISEYDKRHVAISEVDKAIVTKCANIVVNDPELKSNYQLIIDGQKIYYEKTENGNLLFRLNKENSYIDYRFRLRDGKIFIDEMGDGIETLTLDKVSITNPDKDIFLPCPRIVKIAFINSDYYGKEVKLCIKKNFRIATIDHIEGEDELEPVRMVVDMKNDSRYIRVYRNGKLVPRHLPTVRFPEDYNVSEIKVYPGLLREPNDTMMIELMPYMMKQVCYLESIPSDSIIDLKGLIDKPFNFRWYDLYINGRKIAKKDVEIISSNKIKLLKTTSLKWLEIIENGRDKEYFGFNLMNDIIDDLYETDKDFQSSVDSSIDQDKVQDVEDSIITEEVTFEDYILRRFYIDYILTTFGFINPDLNQISEDVVNYYNELITYKPFLINPDAGRIDANLYLPINPDE